MLREIRRQNMPSTNKYYITDKLKKTIYLNKDLKDKQLSLAIDSLIFHIKYISKK